jgi:hypothetical protein
MNQIVKELRRGLKENRGEPKHPRGVAFEMQKIQKELKNSEIQHWIDVRMPPKKRLAIREVAILVSEQILQPKEDVNQMNN